MMAFLADTSLDCPRSLTHSSSNLHLARPESGLEIHSTLPASMSAEDISSSSSSVQHQEHRASTPSNPPRDKFCRSSTSRSSLPRMQPPPKSMPPLQPPPRTLPPILPPPKSPPPSDILPRQPQRLSKRPQPRSRNTLPAAPFRSDSHTSTGVVLDDETTVLDHCEEPPIYFRTNTIDRTWLMRSFDDTDAICPVVSPVVEATSTGLELSPVMPPLSPRSYPRRTSSTSGFSGSPQLPAPSSCSSYSPPTPQPDSLPLHPTINRSFSVPFALEAPTPMSPTSASFHSQAYSLTSHSSTSTRIAPIDQHEPGANYEQLTWVFASPASKADMPKRRFGRRESKKEKHKDKDHAHQSDDSSVFGVSRARGLVRKIWH